MRPYVYIQRLFTDNGAEEPACKFELIESQEHYRMNLALQNAVFTKHFYLYMHVVGEQSYIKVYSLVFSFDSTAANKFTVGPVKKVRYLEDCLNMWTHKFIHYENSFVDYAKHFADIFRDENVILQKREALRPNQNAVNEAVDGEARKIDVPLYLNFQGHSHLMLEAAFKDSVVVQAKSGNHFRLYLGKECVFEFNLNEEVFKHKVSPQETCRLVDIIDGVFRVECAKPSGEKRTIHLDKGMPCIEEHFLVSVLRVFLSVYDSEIYHALVRDVILNCLVASTHQNFNTIYANPVTFDIEDVSLCNFKATIAESHLRITTYFAYLLSVDESAKMMIGEWDDISYPMNPRLSDRIASTESKRAKPSSDDSDATDDPDLSGDQAWTLLQRSAFTDKDLFEAAALFDEQDFEPSHPQQKSPSPSKDNRIKEVMPRVSVTMEMFSQFRVRFFKFLHLLFEDLKLNVMMKDFCEKLGFFLYCYASFLNVGNVSNYIEYYSREMYRCPFDFAACEPLQLIDKIMKKRVKFNSVSNFSSSFELEEKLFDLEMLEEEPYDLLRFVSLVMAGKEPKKFPILFHRTSFVCNIYTKHYGLKDDRAFKVFQRSQNLADSLIESALVSTPVHRSYFSLDIVSALEQKLSNLALVLSLRSKATRPTDEIYLYMVSSRFRYSSLETYSAAVRTILEAIIREVRINLPTYIYSPCLPKGAYTLINREDIYMNILLYPKVKPIRSSSSYLGPSFIERNTSYLSDKTSNENYYSNYSHMKEDKKEGRSIEEYGTKKFASYLEKVNNIRFNETDLVYNEIQRILNISDLIRIKAKYIEHAHEDDRYEYEAEAQVLLRKFVIRRLSVLVGRGAVTINTDRSLFTEILHIPKINFIAFIETTNRKVSLEKKDDNINWPEFHSGVSVGLKIPREILEQKNKDTLRTWIDYQKTNSESYDKPGLIYALGLQGLLYCFLPTDIYLYLKPYFEPRSIGIMLGLAASKIGSREENIMKALAVHLACMLPENTDLQLAMTVECAALVSIGLLYKGTCNKQFSQTMLREILARPNKEKNFERERYPLADPATRSRQASPSD